MNENVMSQLDAELEHAGEETALSPKMLLLEQLRITPEKELPKMDFLFRLFGKPCFPRRELVAITGKAKSGKTFVTSMLTAVGSLPATSEGSICQLPLKRMREEPLHVLWYDTEQSDESTQDILKNRIMTLIKTTTDLTDSTDKNPCDSCNSLFEKSIDAFNVRAVEWKQRRSLLTEAVRRCRPDLVIVDGIRDLVNDINDGVLAQEVMEELLHLATEHDCCIVCVLHQNKSGEDNNLRGWIGTELMYKAFEVYACEKLLPQRVFKLSQTLTRKYDIYQSLYFEVNAEGLPTATVAPEGQPEGDGRGRDQLPQLNAEYIVRGDDLPGGWRFDVLRLFHDAIGDQPEVTGGELRNRVMQLANVCSWKLYNKLLTEATDQKVVEKQLRDGHTYYRIAPF